MNIDLNPKLFFSYRSQDGPWPAATALLFRLNQIRPSSKTQAFLGRSNFVNDRRYLQACPVKDSYLSRSITPNDSTVPTAGAR